MTKKNKLFAFIKLMVIRKKSNFTYSTHTQQFTALFLAIFRPILLNKSFYK